jgi:hypothetical protein
MAKPLGLSDKDRKLWAELNTTIRECGGWSVSQPDTFPLKFECRIIETELPFLLSRLGYHVAYVGEEERLIPITEHQQVGVGTVSVYELHLPPQKPTFDYMRPAD